MSLPSLSIGNLTAKMPVIQGGMGVGVSLSRLASAVANQGGIGVIAGAMIGMKEADVAKNPLEANLRALRQELLKAREMTQGIIGVNIMVALTTFSEMVTTQRKGRERERERQGGKRKRERERERGERQRVGE